MPRLSLERLEVRALPATVFWNVDADGFWDVAGNWRDDQGVNRVPGPADDVVLDRPAVQVTVTQRTSAAVRSLTSREAFVLTVAGTLALAQNSTVAPTDSGTAFLNAGVVHVQGGVLAVGGSGVATGTYQVDAGATLAFHHSHEFRSGAAVQGPGLVRMDATVFYSFSVAGDLALENFELSGGNVRVAGSLSVTRQMTWNGGYLDGPGTTTVPGPATLQIGGERLIKRVTAGHTLHVAGTMLVTGNTVNLELFGALNLPPAATLRVDVQNQMQFLPAALGGVLHNDGRVEVVRGALDFGLRGGTSSGAYHAAAGARIVLPRPHSFTDGAAFTGPGLKSLGGAVRLDGAISGENVEVAGTLTGSHTLTGTFVWRSGSITGEGTTTVAKGGTLTVSGALALDGGHVLHNAGAVIVEADGFLVLEGAYTQSTGRTRLNGGSVFAPLVELQGGVLEGTGFLVADVLNAGRIDVGGTGAAGALYIFGSYTQTATGVLGLEVGGLQPVSGYDYLYVDGVATLDGTLTLGLLNGFQPSPDDLFLILNFGALRGDFAAIDGLLLGDDRAFFPFADETGYYLWTYLL